MKLSKPKTVLLASMALAAFAAALPTAGAALDTTYNPGDLLLGFRVNSGQGSDFNLVVNLGAASMYRDATSNLINIANIGDLLSPVYGASWYDVEGLTMGLMAASNGQASNNSGLVGVGEDPNSTIYISARRTGVGTPGSAASTRPGNSISLNGAVQPAAASITAVGNTFDANDAAGSALLGSATTNGWGSFTTGSNANDLGIFNIERFFTTGSAGTFGEAGAVENFLDLYRVPEYVGGNAPGEDGRGQFLGTFTINSLGEISFITGNAVVPEPSTFGLVALGFAAAAAYRRRMSKSQVKA